MWCPNDFFFYQINQITHEFVWKSAQGEVRLNVSVRLSTNIKLCINKYKLFALRLMTPKFLINETWRLQINIWGFLICVSRRVNVKLFKKICSSLIFQTNTWYHINGDGKSGSKWLQSKNGESFTTTIIRTVKKQQEKINRDNLLWTVWTWRIGIETSGT